MIFGTDNRAKVTDTTAAPWSSIVRLEISFPGSPIKSLATGVLVGPNDVLTAAHVLYNPERGGYASSILIQPARSGGLVPYGDAGAIGIQLHPGYLANGPDTFMAASHDYALVTLGAPSFAPALPLIWTGQGAILGQTVLSGGYPLDRGGDAMFSVFGSVDDTTEDFLVFQDDMDLTGGQSGSPIIQNGAAIGLLNFDQQFNYALRFDATRLADVDFWRTSNDPTAGNDLLYGGPWAETWSGLAGNDTIVGMDGSDTVDGGEGDDDVNGNKGDDLVNGGLGADFVRGGQGNDRVEGNEGDDWHVNGNIGRDTVFGGTGNDNVFGGPDDDLLFGEAGNDVLSGDLGNDTLNGGTGADVFSYSPGSDAIADFVKGEDVIRVPNGATLHSSGDGTRIVFEGGEMLVIGAPSLQAADLWFV